MALFGRRRTSVAKLRNELLDLDQQQAVWKTRVRRAEDDRQELYLRGIRSTEERVKEECADRVLELENNIRHYSSLIAGLEAQKNNLNALIRTLEASEMTADREEMARRQKEIERLTQEVRLSQQRLAESQIDIRAMETGRIDTAPERPPERQRILDAMKAPGMSADRLPKIERE